jgi:hypothetical protein
LSFQSEVSGVLADRSSGKHIALVFLVITLAEDFERQRNRGKQTDAEECPAYGLALLNIELVGEQQCNACTESRASSSQQCNFR